jgi:lipocalin
MKFAAAALCSAAIAVSACPDITKYRTDNMVKSFDATLLEGFWYEQAYIDIAQAGASCQTLNTSFNADTKMVSMDFRVDYFGKKPFTIVEQYFPKNTTDRGSSLGYYDKKADMPGSGLVVLPTVVVDAGYLPESHASSDLRNVPYETMTLFSCDLDVTELIFATRVPKADDAVLEAMKAVAKAAGVTWNEKKLKPVDHSKCA